MSNKYRGNYQQILEESLANLLLVVLKVCFLANVIRMETLITMELRKIILSITASRTGRIICEPWSYWNYL